MNTEFKNQLNSEQYEAVTTTEGAVLVLAGAGTGKTRVITYRIAYIIKEKGVLPGNILAVTFTNKAAEEMKSRLKGIVGYDANSVWMGTFHSICLNILRRDGHKINLPEFFGVIDQEDRLNVIRQAVKSLGLDVKKYPPKSYLHAISSFKNTDDYVENRVPNERVPHFNDVFNAYQESLANQKVIDFDDMLALAVRLFSRNDDTLSEYRNLFKYILVDEYQDTNVVQFKLLYLLSGKTGNICVVGDDDQSIYGWRGAEVRNILEFDKVFDNVKEIKLVENYRSGSSILEKANNLIEYNRFRRGKVLKAFSDKESFVKVLKLSDEASEAVFVSDIAAQAESEGRDLSDIAVLYRTNAQSRNFEVALNKRRIAYKVVGGIGFYQRREIKDILSYLRFYDNKYDESSFRRSIKNPGRGIGDAFVDKVITAATLKNLDLLQALYEVGGTARTVEAVKKYINIINGLDNIESIKEKIDYIVVETNYYDYLKQFEEADEASKRIDNIQELYSAAAAFQETDTKATLSDFLANTALTTSSDESSTGAVRLMTMHAAKGLEFKTVILVGLEENLFPLGSAESDADIEEERRLCYVGITRAKEELYITYTLNRFHFGNRKLSIPSRFLREIGAKSSGGFKQSVINTFSNIGGTFADYIKGESPVKMVRGGGNDETKFPVSSKVIHAVFGEGVVIGTEGSGDSEKSTVQFKKSGIKKILASFLKLR